MKISETFQPFGHFELWLLIIGLALLAAAVVPRFLSRAPMSVAALLLGFGVLAGALGLQAPDPFAHGDHIERVTELGVIIALMTAGLRIDRRPGLKRWAGTWRLLSITMILTIALAAVAGWWIAGLVPATAVLFGAVIAPTDPVLAADVQVGAPMHGSDEPETDEHDPTSHGEEDELRFTLTSESGLNDGLAFPFTNMAIAMALAGAHPGNWFGTWLLIDVVVKIGIAVFTGLAFGYGLARLLLAFPTKTQLAKLMLGMGALAATLIIYGSTQYLGGYGFISTFIGAVVIRNHESTHEYQHFLFAFSEKLERVLMVLILLGLGAAILNGLLAPLTWPLAFTGLLILFVIRPLSGMLGLLGFKAAPWRDRIAISFFGVRGIGSLYYLSYALNQEAFEGAREIWALVGFTVLMSIVVHGVTASPVFDKLDALRERDASS